MTPTREQVKQAREQAGHTQAQAAEVVHRRPLAWSAWELGRNEMDPALYELYLLKTGQKRLRKAS